jgi:hypothetical protein
MLAEDVGRRALAWRKAGIVGGDESIGCAEAPRSSVQRWVVGDRWPRRMREPFNVMCTASEWKVAIHPWSQRRPMERREPDERDGKIWASLAVAGREG